MDIKKVGIVGCGLMGSGIALTAARSGYSTLVRETGQELLNKGLDRIFAFIDKGIEKGKSTPEEKAAVSRNLSGTTRLEELEECDLIIEAVPENLKLKTELFRRIDRAFPAETIFTSNTSSLKITDLAKCTKRKDRFLGTHFFNPVPIMRLCEVVRIEETSEEAFSAVYNFIRSLDKTAVVCQDTTGFVVNRLLTPYLLDAVRAFEAGIASIEDIDQAMILGCGYPMGPLTLIDFVGVETVVHIAGIMSREFGLPQYEAPALLRKMSEKGWHGRKTRFGFFDYSGSEKSPNDDVLKSLTE